jgi:hypothetical protein
MCGFTSLFIVYISKGLSVGPEMIAIPRSLRGRRRIVEHCTALREREDVGTDPTTADRQLRIHRKRLLDVAEVQRSRLAAPHARRITQQAWQP